jgi:hypothetical protein
MNRRLRLKGEDEVMKMKIPVALALVDHEENQR